MTAPVLAAGPVSGAVLNPWFAEIQARLAALEVPQQPKPIFACTKANLPAASGFANCVARVTDLGTVGISNGVNWVHIDTGAVIA